MSNFHERVYGVVCRVPAGRVTSYGRVAALAGEPGAARGVGRALAALTAGSDVPWWRVLNGGGRISLSNVDHGAALQRALLEAEGVSFDQTGGVDLARFGWPLGGAAAGDEAS